MSNYARGVYYERKTTTRLDVMGYWWMRSAGSHGPVDIVAWNTVEVRFIQVKSGNAKLSRLEREQLAQVGVPGNGRRELWHWKPRARDPLITTIGGP